MMLHGKNLIISVNGSVLAASRSCSIEVEAEYVEVASATDGQWKHVISGKKTWKITTNHLVPFGPIFKKIEAYSHANNGITTASASYVKANNTSRVINRGLTLFSISDDFTVGNGETIDTFNTPETSCSEFASLISGAETGILAIVSYDAFGMTSSLRNVIASTLHVDMSGVPVGSFRGALAVIGVKNTEKNTPGIAMYREPENMGFGGSAHVQLNFIEHENDISTFTPIRNRVLMVGGMANISVQVDGLGSDRLTGTALCKSFNAQATVGNLLQGSFSWVGSGPLE